MFHFSNRFVAVLLICLGLSGLSGCQKGTGDQAKPENTPASVKSLDTVTLTGTKIEGSQDSTRLTISASGPFASNIVPKDNPARIIVVLHNAFSGEGPPAIEVNNGTVNRVEIAQLNTGKAPAVKITIGLDRAASPEVTPVLNGIVVNVR